MVSWPVDSPLGVSWEREKKTMVFAQDAVNRHRQARSVGDPSRKDISEEVLDHAQYHRIVLSEQDIPSCWYEEDSFESQ